MVTQEKLIKLNLDSIECFFEFIIQCKMKDFHIFAKIMYETLSQNQKSEFDQYCFIRDIDEYSPNKHLKFIKQITQN